MSGIMKKLFGTHVLVILISFGILTLAISYFMKGYYQKSIVEKLELSAVLIKEILEDSMLTRDVSRVRQLANDLAIKMGYRITVVDPEGRVLEDSEEDPDHMENHSDRLEVQSAIEGRTGKNIRYSDTLKMDMLYVAIPVMQAGRLIGVIRISMPLSDVKTSINYIQRIIFFFVLFGILAAFVLSFLASSIFAKPLISMKETAEQMIKGDYHRRLDVDSSDELGDLANSFNTLSEEIQKRITEIDKDRNELRAILASMVEGVIVIGADNRILITNGSFSEMFDIRFEPLKGSLYWDAIKSSEIVSLLGESITNRRSERREIFIRSIQDRSFLAQISAVFNIRQEFMGVVAVFHDITQLKKLERLRTEFVANISHEIKTPVTAIAGSVETLLEGAIKDKKYAGDFLNIIMNHTRRLNNLVNDLLILSKIETSHIKMNMSPLDLNRVLGNVCKLLEENIRSKRLSVAVDIPSDVGFVLGDEKNMENVFLNLLDNAVKFTPAGGSIRVRAGVRDGQVCTEISDTGIGIPSEHIGRIFERFYRVDATRSRDMGGTGLGLSIVKHIVSSHNGKVTVSSRIGKGSTFCIFLPRSV